MATRSDLFEAGDLRHLSIHVRFLFTAAFVITAVSVSPMLLAQIVEYPTTAAVVGICFVAFVFWTLIRLTIRPPYQNFFSYRYRYYPSSALFREQIQSRRVMNILLYPVSVFSIPLHDRKRMWEIFLPILLAPTALFWDQVRVFLVHHSGPLVALSIGVVVSFLSLLFLGVISRMLKEKREKEARVRQAYSEMSRRYEAQVASARREAEASGEIVARAIMLLRESKKGRPDPLAAEARRLLQTELVRLIPDRVAREAAMFRAIEEMEKPKVEAAPAAMSA